MVWNSRKAIKNLYGQYQAWEIMVPSFNGYCAVTANNIEYLIPERWPSFFKWETWTKAVFVRCFAFCKVIEKHLFVCLQCPLGGLVRAKHWKWKSRLSEDALSLGCWGGVCQGPQHPFRAAWHMPLQWESLQLVSPCERGGETPQARQELSFAWSHISQ